MKFWRVILSFILRYCFKLFVAKYAGRKFLASYEVICARDFTAKINEPELAYIEAFDDNSSFVKKKALHN